MNRGATHYSNSQSPAFPLQNLDLSYLHSVSGGDKAFERDMLQSVVDEMTERIAALHTAIQQSDADGIQMQAHSLKNLAGIIGMPGLAENFSSIEAIAETAPGVYLLQQFLSSQKQWEEAKRAVVQHLATQ